MMCGEYEDCAGMPGTHRLEGKGEEGVDGDVGGTAGDFGCGRRRGAGERTEEGDGIEGREGREGDGAGENCAP